MAMLEDIKIMLDVNDSVEDERLGIIIRNVEKKLDVWFQKHTDLSKRPSELDYIVEEVVIKRFNRIGSEGMTQESVDGRSATYQEDDFAGYASTLETYIPAEDTQSKRGTVLFF